MNKGGLDAFFGCLCLFIFNFLELVNQTLHVRIAGVDAPEVTPEHVHSISKKKITLFSNL